MAWDFDCEPILNSLSSTAFLTKQMKSFVVEKTAEFVLEYIQSEWPVDTALSFSSFYVDDGKVKNSTDYAQYVHDGLVDVLAREGLDASRNYAQGVVNDMIRRASLPAGKANRQTLEQSIELANPIPPLPASGSLQKLLSVKNFNPTQKVRISTQALLLFNQGKISEFEKDQFNKGKIKQTIRRLLRSGKREQAKKIADSI